MNSIRIMTYNVHGCRGRDGQADPCRVLDVIAEAAPDIVALQGLTGGAPGEHLNYLAERLGMHRYQGSGPGASAFLSCYPLKGLQEYQLGHQGSCLRADANVAGKCLHLFNLRLSRPAAERRSEIAQLLGPELLGARSLVCPTLVLGDFADHLWGAGNFSLTLALRKAQHPFWSGTYPAWLPLLPRDRGYIRGDLKILQAAVNRSAMARQASSHLPLVLTVQVTDPRNYLRVEKLKGSRMEIAPG